MSYAQNWLQTIRYAEGTSGPDGYQTTFGYGQPLDLNAPHPERVNTSGGYSSAASGAYQFMPSTWKGVHGGQNVPMTPETQDRAALKLIRQRGVDPDRDPLTPENVAKLAPEWASLPTLEGKSYYGQPVKGFQELQSRWGATSGQPAPTARPATPRGEPSNPFAAIGLAGLAGLVPSDSGTQNQKGKPRLAQSDEFGGKMVKLANSMLALDEKEDARSGGAGGEGRRRPSASDIPDLPDVPDVSSVGLAAIRKLGGIDDRRSAAAPSAAGAATAAPTQTSTPRSGAEGSMDLLSFNRTLRDGTGLKFAENPHPDLGGRVGGHSNGSLHGQNVTLPDGSQVGRAVDITDWRNPDEPESTWKPRKAALEQSWQEVASRYPGTFEIYGPSSDPGGHGTHIHLGVLADQVPASAAQEFLAAEAEVRRRFPLGR